MTVNGYLTALVEYGLKTGLIQDCDRTYIVNQLLMEVETPGLSREYTENNIIPGNMIVITDGQCTREAYAESIAPDGRLLVREQDGSETLLSYGEVSVRRKSDQG